MAAPVIVPSTLVIVSATPAAILAVLSGAWGNAEHHEHPRKIMEFYGDRGEDTLECFISHVDVLQLIDHWSDKNCGLHVLSNLHGEASGAVDAWTYTISNHIVCYSGGVKNPFSHCVT
jgi:hypothetical protein